MRVRLQVTFGRDLEREILECHPSLANKLEDVHFWSTLYADEPLFDDILHLASGHVPSEIAPGIRLRSVGLRSEMVYTPNEFEQVTHFKALGRTIRDASKQIEDHNYLQLDRAPAIDCGSFAPIKIPVGLRANPKHWKPLTIKGIMEWAQEYACHEDVINILRSQDPSGLQCEPMFDRIGRPLDRSLFQLASPSVMCPAILGHSVWDQKGKVREGNDPSTRYIQCGSTCYPRGALSLAKDYNRTAEPWAANSSPSWVVSRSVYSLFKQKRVQGWWFIPVLEEGTALYDEHERMWSELMKKVIPLQYIGF